MKKQLLKYLACVALILTGTMVWSQNPTYTCSITNAKMVSEKIYEFDVILQQTGTIELKLSHFQLGIKVNPAIIPAGATIAISPVAGSSALLKDQQPGPERFSFDNKSSCIRVVAVSPKKSNVYTSISKAETGTRLCRIRVSCSQAFTTGVSTNHTWNFSYDTGYATKLFAWVGATTVVTVDITVPASHLKSKSPAGDIIFAK
jgi:hypothetical protein